MHGTRRLIWTADGRHLVMEGTSPPRLSVIATDGSEQQPQPASALGHFHPLAWSDDGRGVLAVQFAGGPSTTDIVRWQPDKPDEREAVVQTAAQDGFRGASLSPDGRWLAHTSDQSGQTEVWVRPYPGPGVPVRVSTNGGIEPVWSRTGHELYYLEGQRVMAVAVRYWLDVRVQAANMALRQPLPGLRSTLVLRCRGRRPVSDD